MSPLVTRGFSVSSLLPFSWSSFSCFLCSFIFWQLDYLEALFASLFKRYCDLLTVCVLLHSYLSNLVNFIDAALEARNHIQCSMTVRVLNEDDTLLSSISPKGNMQSIFLVLPFIHIPWTFTCESLNRVLKGTYSSL